MILTVMVEHNLYYIYRVRAPWELAVLADFQGPEVGALRCTKNVSQKRSKSSLTGAARKETSRRT